MVKTRSIHSAERFDSFRLGSIRKIPTGNGGSYFLEVDGTLAVPGVMTYDEDGQEIREYVPPEVLQDPEWLKAMNGAPLTLEHPPALLTPQTVAAYQVGSLVQPYWNEDEQAVKGTLRVLTDRAIRAVESGAKQFLSPGYKLARKDGMIFESGIAPDGKRYDRRQNRREIGNHQAITSHPRGGSDCRMDSEDMMDPAIELAKMLCKYLGIECPEGKEVETATAALKGAIDKAAVNGGAEKTDAGDKAMSRFDQLEAKLDAMSAFMSAKKDEPGEGDVKTDADPDHVEPDADDKGGKSDKDADDAGVKMDSADFWLKIARVVKKLGIPEKDLAGKKAPDVRNLCLARMDSSLPGKRSESYLQARFDAELAHFSQKSGVQSVIDRSHGGESSTGGDDGYSGSTFGDRLLKLGGAKK